MIMQTYRIRKPKIVVVGGGTGLPVILKGLRNQGVDITAVVTVADDGGSSGKIRESTMLAPPGDLRNVLVSLSDMPKLYEDIFQYRFKKEDKFLANHALGNIIIAGLSEMQGSIYEAIQILSKMLHVEGKILPSSEDPLILNAIFTDGTLATGESKIALARKKIDYVYVRNQKNSDTPKSARKVVDSIIQADMIVLGPGSLFTSILPNLMIPEIGQAIIKTKAEIVYICNIMTQKGETECFSDADHVHILHKHLKHSFIDTVLVNTAKIPEKYINYEIYNDYVEPVKHDFESLCLEKCNIISTNLLKLQDEGVFHDGDKVIQKLMKIVYKKI